MENLYLIYVKPLGKNTNEEYEYEFFFSETPDTVWGENWNVACPSACGDLTPEESTYSVIKRVKDLNPILCVQQNSCFSMQDCIDGIIALCWFEDFSVVFKFGESYKDVENKLANVNIHFD